MYPHTHYIIMQTRDAIPIIPNKENRARDTAAQCLYCPDKGAQICRPAFFVIYYLSVLYILFPDEKRTMPGGVCQ